jgi:hypothetical protein
MDLALDTIILAKMTHEQINNLQAGPETDRLIAHHIFGQNVDGIWIQGFRDAQPISLAPGSVFPVDSHWSYPHTEDYSTDIAAAMLVFDKLKDQDKFANIVWNSYHKTYGVTLNNRTGNDIELPLAICKTALISTL